MPDDIDLESELRIVEVRMEDITAIRDEQARLARERDQARNERDVLQAVVGHLRAALKEVSDDLEAWIENHYERTKDHGLRRQYERDMGPVLQARALLEK